MMTQTGVSIQDQNLNVHLNGKEPIVFKVQKKEGGGLSGRKALGDLTNSGKPSPIKASKKLDSKIPTSAQEEIDASRSKHSVCGKKVQTGGRKPLSDVSNTKKQTSAHRVKKSHKNVKPSVCEEHFDPNSIAEEQFLHNHEECIKAQRMNKDMDYFPKTIGLQNGLSMQLRSCHVRPSSRKPKVHSESPWKIELEKIAETVIEDQSPLCLKTELPSEYKSSFCPPKSPKSPNSNTGWKDNFAALEEMEVNFTLMDTPVLPKH